MPSKGRVLISSSLDAVRSPKDASDYIREENLKEIIEGLPGHTQAVNDEIRKLSYYGMWIRLSGRVADVGKWTGANTEVQLYIYSRRPDAFMTFDDKVTYDQLLALRPKKHIDAIGQIADITPRGILMAHCEIRSSK